VTSKTLRLIALLLAIAALLALPRLFRSGGRGSLDVEGGFAFRVSGPVTRVDVIQLSTGDTISLRRTDGTWVVGAFAADTAKIRTLLENLPELHADQLVARNPSNHERLGVAEGTGRRIEVYTESGGPFAFRLGNRDLAAGGYYVREPEGDEVFRLDGPTGGYLSRDRDGWRDRVIARVDTAAVRDLIIRRGGDETVLRLADGAWTVDGAAADTAAVRSMLRLLANLSTSGFPSDEQARTTDFSTPDAELDVFVEGGGGVTDRELGLGLRLVQDEDAGDWLVRRLDGSDVYRLAAFAVRQLLPATDVLLPGSGEGDSPDSG